MPEIIDPALLAKLTIEPGKRSQGVVFHDPALDAQPATHVLVIGCGHFADKALAPLTSSTASARALAGWFLDGALGRGPGFANPARGLGSLAILLSETADGQPSQVEGGPVPRAVFSAVQTALKAWATRAAANPDNTAILIMSSHGQSFGRQTAVLFEDYGSDPAFNAFAGMTEVEQLTDALSNLAPRNKLLVFDCCRLPTDLNLIPGNNFGSPLITTALPPGASAHRPQVLRSTRLGGAAYGQPGQPSLFSAALLDALGGCAADPGDDWKIGSFRVGEHAGKILGLWRQDGEKLQIPGFELSDTIILAQVPETDQAALYVSLAPGHDIASARLELHDAAGIVQALKNPVGPEPFIRVPIPERQPFRLLARDAAGGKIGEIELKVLVPVAFRELPRDSGGAARQVNRAKSMGIVAQEPRIRIATRPVSSRTLPGVAEFRPILHAGDKRVAAPLRTVLNEKGRAALTLPAGEWTMSLRRPGAPDTVEAFTVETGDQMDMDMPSPSSAQEWLEDAMAAGVVDLDMPRDPGPPPPDPALHIHLPDGTPITDVTSQPVAKNGRLSLFEVQDKSGDRLAPRWSDGPNSLPVWADVEGDGWRERVFLPVQGAIALHAFQTASGVHDPWRAFLLIDAHPKPERSHSAAFVASERWGGILAFLGRRAFRDAGAALDAADRAMPLRDAVMGKIANPLAAMAAALVAVAANRTEALGIPDDWLANLCTWFPGLPDGAVILARQRLRRGEDATEPLAMAVARGVPVFSLAVDWLAEALSATGHPEAAAARARAMATDPTRVFTTMRLS